jgi:hypothetical protein
MPRPGHRGGPGEGGEQFLVRGGPGNLLQPDADVWITALEFRQQPLDDLAFAPHHPEAERLRLAG